MVLPAESQKSGNSSSTVQGESERKLEGGLGTKERKKTFPTV
jgi:hypothetical protein